MNRDGPRESLPTASQALISAYGGTQWPGESEYSALKQG